jgi:hypothetical protein
VFRISYLPRADFLDRDGATPSNLAERRHEGLLSFAQIPGNSTPLLLWDRNAQIGMRPTSRILTHVVGFPFGSGANQGAGAQIDKNDARAAILRKRRLDR